MARARTPATGTIVLILLSSIVAPATASTSSCTGISVSNATELGRAVASNSSGATFCLAPGTYRLSGTLGLRTGQALIGAGDPGTVVISGARIVQATAEGGRWMIAGQRTLGQSKFSGTTAQCRSIGRMDPKGMCVYRDQVFLDDVSLWQVRSLTELSSGEFYWNYSTNRIYLTDDPTGRRLEVSVVGGRAITGYSGNRIENIVVEKFGNPVQTGAVSAGLGWTIVDSEIRLNHGGGVHMGPGTLLQRNHIHHNGQLGIHGGQPSCARAQGLIAKGNEIAFNNAAGYNWGWEGGASKWNNTEGLVIRGNHVHHNYGMGLWTDGMNANVLVENNVVEDNEGMGINHELGQAAIIRNNDVRRNGFSHPIMRDAFGAGIFIDQSRDVEVYGNVVKGNAAGITAVQQPAGAYCGYPEAEVVNLFVHDNTIHQGRGIAAGLRLINESDPSYFGSAKNNRWENNTYLLPDVANGLSFKWRGRSVNGRWQDTYHADAWRAFGQDTSGTFAPIS